ncbi:transposase family protein [Neisseria meningitidis M13265]|nr:transposase family protein [Neisseria meningitidis M13265]
MLIHYIDIAKRNFVIAVSSLSKTKTETNNPKGIAHTIEYLKKHKVALVVTESTGGLEIPAAKAIHRAGIAVIIANPRQTHQFAQSQSLTKTDAKDAKMPAFFAQMRHRKKIRKPCPTTRPPKWKKCWKPWLTAATNWWICGLPRKTVCIRFMKRKSEASNN